MKLGCWKAFFGVLENGSLGENEFQESLLGVLESDFRGENGML